MIRIIAIIALLTGCKPVEPITNKDTTLNRSTEYQQEITQLLLIDKQNKLLEEEYLREIAIAEENQDQDAYKFYFNEYIEVPRIPLEDWMEQEPGFYPRKSAKQVVLEYKNSKKSSDSPVN